MLTKFHKALLALLVVQIGIAAFVLSGHDDSVALKEQPVLAGFDAAQVTRVQIFEGTAPAKVAVDLAKRDANWVVASAFDYPVAASKVTDALSPLAKMAAAEPIATQSARHKQLKVADDDFERKLVITMNGKDVTLFIGAAAGGRRTAVRVGGEGKVWGASGVTAFAFGSEPRLWVDTRYLDVPHDDVVKMTVVKDGSTTELFKATPSPTGSGSGSGSAAPAGAPQWTATVNGAPFVLAADESIDVAAIDRAISGASTIELAAPADPKRDAAHPTATITLDRKATGTTTPAPVVIDVIADGTKYWVHDRSSPRAILVDKPRLEDSVKLDRDQLVKKASAKATKPPIGAPGGTPDIKLPEGFPGME